MEGEMKKRIVVFIGEIAGAYQQIVVKRIISYANQLGYDVAIICSYGLYNDDMMYSDGEKACINLPDCASFDGIIVAEDLFDIPNMGDELYQNLKSEAKCPVVYLRSKREGFYSILVENVLSTEKMVRHFTDVHGFTDICYMAGKADNIDSIERLQGYLNVMNEKHILVTEHMIFEGDYWRDKGEEALDWFMKGRTEYPQAIVCANDYMAISICDELKKRGKKVPEDVCVGGFDFVFEAQSYRPTLTSLEVDFEKMSMRAVDIIDSVNNGNTEPMEQRVEANLRLQKSCGCGEQIIAHNYSNIMSDNYQQILNMKNIMLATMEYQDSFEFDEYMDVAARYRSCIGSDRVFFCFNDIQEQGYDEVENDSQFTNNMVLFRVLEGKKKVLKIGKVFPRKQLLPTEYWAQNKTNNYLFFVIHFKNIVYGYMATELPSDGWFSIFTQGYLLTLANAIQNSNVHKQMEHLEEIRTLYQKDILTGLYNRRGFDKILHERFEQAKENGENIGICSLDMDNLKLINDNLGHSEGDKALQAIANALECVIEEGEFCGRIGGDEFAAVINLVKPERKERFVTEFENALRKSYADHKDFRLGASIGICEIAEHPYDSLINCMNIADMRMYEVKRARKKDERI